MCALSDALIGEADGGPEPGSCNDRPPLGPMGTMGEAEPRNLKGPTHEGGRAKAGPGGPVMGPPRPIRSSHVPRASDGEGPFLSRRRSSRMPP